MLPFSPRAMAGRLLTWAKDHGWLFLLVCLVSAKCVYLTLAMGLNYGKNFGGVYSTFFFTAIVALLFNLAFRFRGAQALWVGSLLVGMVIHADLVYFRFYGELLYSGMFSQVGNFGSIYKSILTLLRPSDLVFYLDVPFWALAAWRRPILPRIPKRALLLALSLAVGLFFVRHENLPLQRVIQSFSADHYQRTDLIEMGILHYHVQDLASLVAKVVFPEPALGMDDEREVASLALRPLPAPGPLHGKFSRKNLLVIQMESLQGFVIGKRIGGEEITPFLNRLAGESLYFSNFYHQTGTGRTSDAELLTQNAYFGLPKGVAFETLRNNRFVSLPKLLRDQGYDTFSMHGNSGAFYNRTRTHQSLGFARSYFEQQLDGRDRLGMGISDKAFFAQSLEVIKQAKRPFYGFLISLSAHHPYDDPFEFEHPLQAKGSGLLGNYFQAVHYADEALESLFRGLEAEGLLEDTIVVVYGDHEGVGRDQQAQLTEFLARPLDELDWLELRRVPLMIRVPGEEPRIYEELAGQIDLAPTLAGLLGFQEPVFLASGQDLLATPRDLMVLRDGSWLDRDHAYVVGPSGIGALAFEREGRRPVPVEPLAARVEEARRHLWLSDVIMKHDLMESLRSRALASPSLAAP